MHTTCTPMPSTCTAAQRAALWYGLNLMVVHRAATTATTSHTCADQVNQHLSIHCTESPTPTPIPPPSLPPHPSLTAPPHLLHPLQAGAGRSPTVLFSTAVWAMSLISGGVAVASVIVNDYFDYPVDLRNAPHKPLPSGRVKPDMALLFSSGIYMSVLIAACFMESPQLRSIVAFSAGATLLYTPLFKKLTAIKNATVASVVALAPIAGEGADGLCGLWCGCMMIVEGVTLSPCVHRSCADSSPSGMAACCSTTWAAHVAYTVPRDDAQAVTLRAACCTHRISPPLSRLRCLTTHLITLTAPPPLHHPRRRAGSRRRRGGHAAPVRPLHLCLLWRHVPGDPDGPERHGGGR